MIDPIAALHQLSGVLPILLLGLAGVMLFLMLPISNILNIVTIPLGYQFTSCPYCPAFGIEKITYTCCAVCGVETAENWGTSWSPADDDQRYYVCDECSLNELEKYEGVSES